MKDFRSSDLSGSFRRNPVSAPLRRTNPGRPDGLLIPHGPALPFDGWINPDELTRLADRSADIAALRRRVPPRLTSSARPELVPTAISNYKLGTSPLPGTAAQIIPPPALFPGPATADPGDLLPTTHPPTLEGLAAAALIPNLRRFELGCPAPGTGCSKKRAEVHQTPRWGRVSRGPHDKAESTRVSTRLPPSTRSTRSSPEHRSCGGASQSVGWSSRFFVNAAKGPSASKRARYARIAENLARRWCPALVWHRCQDRPAELSGPASNKANEANCHASRRKLRLQKGAHHGQHDKRLW